MDQRSSCGKTPARKRILVVDDHPTICWSFRQWLDREADLAVAGEAGDVRTAKDLLQQGEWDLAIIDLFLGQEYGLELIKDIGSSYRRLPILAVSGCDEETDVLRVLAAGAGGFWHKSEPVERIVIAARTVLAHKQYVSDDMACRLVSRRHSKVGPNDVARLSDRELEVFELTGHGHSAQEVAQRLHLDPHTVETYRARIKEKLGLRDVIELAARAGRWAADQWPRTGSDHSRYRRR